MVKIGTNLVETHSIVALVFAKSLNSHGEDPVYPALARNRSSALDTGSSSLSNRLSGSSAKIKSVQHWSTRDHHANWPGCQTTHNMSRSTEFEEEMLEES